MSTTKPTLLAQLAAARAQLWCALLSVPESTLATQLIAGVWTAKDTLAHLAFWDDFRAGQLELLLAGHVDQITMPDTDARNARVYAKYHDWPLDQIVDEVQEARARLLAALDPLTDQDLDRSFTVPVFGTVTVRAWIERRINHDKLHTGPILDWRATTQHHEPGPKCVLVAALDSARHALVAWREVLSADELATRPIAGTWTYQDILGHVADWEDWFVRSIEDMQAGQAGGQGYEGDFEAWNTSHLQARRGEPFAETWQALVERRWDLLELLEAFDDRRLAQPVEAELAGFERFYFWFACAAEHELEHAEAVEAGLVG
jgi:uncharacterized damage-inducible protein DinB